MAINLTHSHNLLGKKYLIDLSSMPLLVTGKKCVTIFVCGPKGHIICVLCFVIKTGWSSANWLVCVQRAEHKAILSFVKCASELLFFSFRSFLLLNWNVFSFISKGWCRPPRLSAGSHGWNFAAVVDAERPILLLRPETTRTTSLNSGRGRCGNWSSRSDRRHRWRRRRRGPPRHRRCDCSV